MDGIIAVDIGTTSLRTTLYDAEGRAMPAEQRLNPPTYCDDGRVEQEAHSWLSLLPTLLRASAARAEDAGLTVAAISLTAQRSSVIAVDREGDPLAPAIMWQDRRTTALAAELASANAAVHAATGIQISPVFSALKMLWIRRSHPEMYARTHKFLGIQDLVLHFLTGRFVTDESLASRTNLLNLGTRSWDPSLEELFDVDGDKLCDILPPGSVVGGLLPSVARETGLAAGTPVVTAGGDQQCAALGLGLFAGERAVTNTGTGSYVLGHATRPIVDAEMRVSTNVSALPGAYVLEAILPASGSVYRWFREELWNGRDESESSWEAINAAAEAAGPGAGGVLLLPHFNGSGTPHWDAAASGVFCGLSLSTKRGDLARAILEGIAMELAGGLRLLEELLGPIAEVRVSGGMAGSRLFNRVQADVFGRPVSHFRGGEATSLGAWMAGAAAIGAATSYAEAFARATASTPQDRLEPDIELHRLYERLRSQAAAVYTAVAQTGAGRSTAAVARERDDERQ